MGRIAAQQAGHIISLRINSHFIILIYIYDDDGVVGQWNYTPADEV